MKLTICAIGRLRSGPERALVDDYRTRFERTGRPVGLARLDEVEIDERSASGAVAQCVRLARAVPAGAQRIALDERGATLSSQDLARRLAALRDGGAPAVSFCLGGADGLTDDFRTGSDAVIGFGPMVWPHRLARVMLAEQLYRAAAILAGSPYHRD